MKKLENYLLPLYNLIEKMFVDEQSGHDINHLLRVLNYAREIQKYEGGDKKIVLVSALVHDFHRLMSNEKGCFVSPDESIELVKDIILKSEIEISNYELEQVLDIVAKHDEKDDDNNDSIELKIIKDADTMDAMGKIGLDRTLTYCKVHKIPIYDPRFPLDQDGYVPNTNPISCVHYVYRTMLPNSKILRTYAARELATKVEDFIEKHVNSKIKDPIYSREN